MGYAGYVSTTAKIKDLRTPLQQALLALPIASLEVLEKITYNTACLPAEDKYRRLKLSNAKISAAVTELPAAMEALSLTGWQEVEEEGERYLVLPRGTNMTMAQVRVVQEAQQEVKKNEKSLQRNKSAASLPGGDDQQRLRAQLEADRRERALLEGTAQASVAQPLPNGGSNIRTAGEAGLNSGGCC